MSETTYMRGNRGDSWLLMVGSQFSNLTPNRSFGHNLCFKCPNGSCEPILDIYVSKAFEWSKELFNPMGFDPCNCILKIQDSNSQNGSSFGSMEVQFSHFPILSTSQGHELWLMGFTLGPHLCKPLPWLQAQG
jgi:hypothetical protein